MTFGLIANLFTGLMVTYTLCAFWFQMRDSLSLGRIRLFKNAAFDFIGKRFASWTFSGIMIVAGLGAVLFINGGLQFGVDFAGGLRSQVRFDEPTSENQLREMLTTAGLEDPRVQGIAGTQDYILRVKEVEGEESATIGKLQATQDVLNVALTETYGEAAYEVVETVSFGAETGRM